MATAAQEFLRWLDTVSVDTSAWSFTEESRSHPYFNNADKKYRKTQGYIHRHMMDNSDWYRRSVEYAQEIMLLDESELGIEPDPLTINQKGFWDQF